LHDLDFVSTSVLDHQWLSSLTASADRPPLRPRVPLIWGAQVIGSVEPEYLSQIDLQRWPALPEVLQREQSSESLPWRVRGELTLVLAQIAQALLQAQVGSVLQQWRNEQLAVCDAQGRQLATVERGVVRPLGIATRAVHLVGRTSDGRYWLQQRALNKANDPGQWDTLMGGMVSAKDTVQTALERETWEEAGLRLTALEQVRWGGRVDLRKPCSDDAAGYVVEQTDWYHCTVPDGVQPVNQDGEVEQFLLLDKRELIAKLQRDEFTTEAALILVAALHLP
jgi:8-oxo-dGTP pyrophosphatase MutT (NUDIX family)